jgi:hypothetical protein
MISSEGALKVMGCTYQLALLLLLTVALAIRGTHGRPLEDNTAMHFGSARGGHVAGKKLQSSCREQLFRDVGRFPGSIWRLYLPDYRWPNYVLCTGTFIGPTTIVTAASVLSREPHLNRGPT